MAEAKSIKTTGVTGLELGKQGNLEASRPAVIFRELTGVSLLQLAVFPEQLAGFKTSFKRQTGVADLPQMSSSYCDQAGLVVRPELTKFWWLRPASARCADRRCSCQIFPP